MKKCFLVIAFSSFVCVATVNADPIVYRGAYGEYYPQEGDMVVLLNDGNLQVTRPGGDTAVINLSTPPTSSPTRQMVSGGDMFVYRNSHKPVDGSMTYYDPKEIVALRRQDVEEAKALSKINIDQRRQSGRELDDRHDRRRDWSKEGRSWKRDLDKQSDRKVKAEASRKKEEARAREKSLKGLGDSVGKFQKQAGKNRQQFGDRIERAQIRQRLFGAKTKK